MPIADSALVKSYTHTLPCPYFRLPPFKVSPMLRTACLLLSTVVFFAAVQADDTVSPSARMLKSADQFLGQLSEDQKTQVLFGFDDPERLNWHFIPRERKGVGLWDLEGEALMAANNLVKSGLSNKGFEKILQVRSLEEVLYLFERGDEEQRRKKRHPHKYYLTIFGKPGTDSTWGWRFEGHHLSLNYTLKNGQIVSSTPEFMGANPGLIDAGPKRKLRVLGEREDIARSILKACPQKKMDTLWVSKTPPKEVRGPGVPQPIIGEPEGLSFAQMTTEQQNLLRKLIGQYLTAMPASVVNRRMKRISNDGMDSVYFGWWGGSELNEPHHYVVQGPSFVIEYNNVQNSANHVHAMWRNLDGDFAVPATK